MTMSDAFTPYERGLKEFQQKLGKQHARLLDFLNYDHQLCTNIRQARDDGDTPTLSAERSRIVKQLNTLALETMGVSFNEMCGLGRHEPVLTIPIVELSPWVMLFFNLVAVIILALILGPLVSVSLPCVSPLASAPSLAVILLVLFNLFWRYLNPVIKVSGGTVKVAWVAFPIKVLASLSDALHPWIISNPVLWVLAIVLFLAAGLVGVGPFSLFPVQESTPIIQDFLVHYADSQTETFAAGDLVEIPAYTQALVEAVVSGQADVSCTWSAVKGTQLPQKRCATIYSPPFEGNQDALSVLAQSPCKTWQAFAGLHINVVQVQPQP